MPSRPSTMSPALSNSPLICWSICTPSSARPLHTSACLRSPLITWKEEAMQSTDLEEIKAALWEQASHPCTRVSWGVAQVMAVRKSRGQLLVLLRGWKRWCPVEAVTIERPKLCPTGGCDLEEGPDQRSLLPKRNA